MNARRVAAIATHEARHQLSTPVFWLLLGVLLFVTSSLNPTAMLPSDEATVGGVRPFVNSPHALAQSFALGGFFAYTVCAALLGGFAILRDDEVGIADLLHSTPMSSAEYVLGKLGGVLAALGVALLVHLALALVFLERQGGDAGGPAVGPFELGSYVQGLLLFALPGALAWAVLAFVVGERTRRPMAVYAVPNVGFTLTLAFTWTWAPAELAPWVDRLLCVLDPTGLRWLSRVAFGVDRGLAFYNQAPLPLDATFWLNRALLVLGSTAGIASAVRHVRDRLRGAAGESAARSPVAPARGASRASAEVQLAALGMRARPPGLWAGARSVGAAEARELWRRPALLFFGAFLFLVILEAATGEPDVFGTTMRLTAGDLATRTLPVATILVCAFLLFVLVESFERDRGSGFAALAHSFPLSTGSLLLGKGLGAAVAAAALSGTCVGAGVVALLLEEGGRVELGPLLLVFGLVLAPTLLLWAAFVMALVAVLPGRAEALAAGFAALAATALLFLSGELSWVTNWPLWGALRWSDVGVFPLQGRALVLNRAAAVAVAVLLFAFARGAFERRESDGLARQERFRVRWLARQAWRLAPFAVAPILITSFLALEVSQGFEGEAAVAKAREHQRWNAATWSTVEPAQLARLEVDIDLQPSAGRAQIVGHLALRNATAAPMRWLPFTLGPSFGPVRWTLEGQPTVAEERGHLALLTPASPLAPGAQVRVGFAYTLTHPAGLSRNGGGAQTFISAAGTLLSTHRGEFLPVPGYAPVGPLPARERLVAAALPDGSRPPGSTGGGEAEFSTWVRVRAPAAYTVNAVGVKTAEWQDGDHTTVVWESDRPVAALSLAAGRWAVQRRGDNAVFHHPGHADNAQVILDTLVAARERYGAWFHPYPWRELRVSEFPNLETNATAFPTHISFSEGIGFLAGGEPSAGLAFSVTAHEVSHQWWGHLVPATHEPGSGLLAEGLANYSTLLLHEAENGPASRIAFARQLERAYLEQRRIDAERPVLATLEGNPSDEAVLSLRGAWVLWMLQEEIGWEAMQRGLRNLIAAHAEPRRPAGPAELLAALRAQAADSPSFDRFVSQWLAGTALPEYRLSEPRVRREGEAWKVEVTVENVGTGAARVEVAAVQGRGDERAAERVRPWLEPGRPVRLTWTCAFEPERILVDPEVRVLQLNRDLASVAVRATIAAL